MTAVNKGAKSPVQSQNSPPLRSGQAHCRKPRDNGGETRKSRWRGRPRPVSVSHLLIWRWRQQFTVVHALYRVDLDIGFLFPRKADVGKNQERLRAVRDIEAAIKGHRLHA